LKMADFNAWLKALSIFALSLFLLVLAFQVDLTSLNDVSYVVVVAFHHNRLCLVRVYHDVFQCWKTVG